MLCEIFFRVYADNSGEIWSDTFLRIFFEKLNSTPTLQRNKVKYLFNWMKIIPYKEIFCYFHGLYYSLYTLIRFLISLLKNGRVYKSHVLWIFVQYKTTFYKLNKFHSLPGYFQVNIHHFEQLSRFNQLPCLINDAEFFLTNNKMTFLEKKIAMIKDDMHLWWWITNITRSRVKGCKDKITDKWCVNTDIWGKWLVKNEWNLPTEKIWRTMTWKR